MNKILQLIEDGKEDHDEKYMDFPMNSMFEESYRINTVPYVSSQGSLISEIIYTLVPSLFAKSLSLNFSIKCENLMDSDLVQFFLEDRTILKTPSEIKPPLKKPYSKRAIFNKG